MQNRTRGKQHTPYLAAQERDFSGLCYGKITPTDIDAYLDFGNKLHVYIEAKLPAVDLPDGQRIALEHTVDDMHDRGRYACGIVCEHPNRIGVIDFATCFVVMYRWKTKWLFPQEPKTTREAVDALLRRCNLAFYIGKQP